VYLLGPVLGAALAVPLWLAIRLPEVPRVR
jgi:hypothetical protein